MGEINDEWREMEVVGPLWRRPLWWAAGGVAALCGRWGHSFYIVPGPLLVVKKTNVCKKKVNDIL